MNYTIINADSAHALAQFPDNHFHSIVCDPPYGIDFLGKTWDHNTGDRAVYEQCLRVLRPGGHILAFSAARTYHHLAMTLEQVGFEIRDQIMWIYGSGFPKSQDVGKNIDRAAGKPDPNYGSKKTAKQGNETVGDFATGARCGKCNKTFNADIIRDCKQEPCGMRYTYQTETGRQWAGWGTNLKPAHEPICMARKPMPVSVAKNVQQWGTGAINVDACRVAFTDEQDRGTGRFPANIIMDPEAGAIHQGETNSICHGLAGASRFFYCAKVNKRERNTGVENTHPTVKPVDLMRYLIQLVTPPGGRVLDPFAGSGSTGMAAVELGHEFVGIEREAAYAQIAQQRIEAWHRQCHPLPTELFEEAA